MSKAMLRRVEALEQILSSRELRFHVVNLPTSEPESLNFAEAMQAWRTEAIAKKEIFADDFCVFTMEFGSIGYIGKSPGRICRPVHHGVKRAPLTAKVDPPPSDEGPAAAEAEPIIPQEPLPEAEPALSKTRKITDFFEHYAKAWWGPRPMPRPYIPSPLLQAHADNPVGPTPGCPTR